MPYPTAPLVACPQCDALQMEPALVPGGSADCVRCGAELYRYKPGSIDRTLAFTLAAAILFAFANIYPLMEMDARGLRSATTLFGTVQALSEEGMPSVGLLVFATALALPVVELAAMIYMLLPLRVGVVPPGLRYAFRLVDRVRVWGMAEVLLLGALIAFVKLKDIAAVHPGIALYSLGGFVFLLAAADAWYEPRAVWHCARELST
ncbi:MAG TPA: paraquat-inducible protein A [Usitatibacter sp.]|jgi:paraquat-inducible protein A